MRKFFLSEDIDLIIESIDINKNNFNNSNIAIAGAFGFLGKYFLECFIKLKKKHNININIYAIDNFITSDNFYKKYYENHQVNCINHNINDKIQLDVEFDYIICLAGIASPYYYNKYPVETLNVSINGLKNMFDLKHKDSSKFIFFSSSEIYGDPSPDQIPTQESYRGNVSSIGPRACYDESKRVGETICYINSTYFNKNVSIIRPFNVYGPGMSIKDYRIIPNITRSYVLKDKLKIYNTGEQTRTYCYISDAITGFLKVILNKEKFGIYNIGNDVGEISVNDLLKLTEKVMNTKLNYIIAPYPAEYPPDEPQRRCPNINKAKANLDFLPIIDLEKGLSKHLNWAKENIKID